MALCNEYCHTLENARESDSNELTNKMIRLLPRIYISATDLKADGSALLEQGYIENRLEEDYYNSLRCAIENLLGPDDTYLEVFEEDMKYSDTPIAASIAEGLADMFQVMYNFLEAVRDMPTEVVASAVCVIKEDFESYWSRILCNVLRALNRVAYYSN